MSPQKNPHQDEEKNTAESKRSEPSYSCDGESDDPSITPAPEIRIPASQSIEEAPPLRESGRNSGRDPVYSCGFPALDDVGNRSKAKEKGIDREREENEEEEKGGELSFPTNE